MPPPSQFGAIDVVQIPDAKATQKDPQPACDHEPHELEHLGVPIILSLLLLFLKGWDHILALHDIVRPLPLFQARPDVDLHHIYGSEEDNGGE